MKLKFIHLFKYKINVHNNHMITQKLLRNYFIVSNVNNFKKIILNIITLFVIYVIKKLKYIKINVFKGII